MKAVVKSNFRANGVQGVVGKQLTDQEIQKIGPLMKNLIDSKVIEADQSHNEPQIQLEEVSAQSIASSSHEDSDSKTKKKKY
jgi:hypothetical protein